MRNVLLIPLLLITLGLAGITRAGWQCDQKREAGLGYVRESLAICRQGNCDARVFKRLLQAEYELAR